MLFKEFNERGKENGRHLVFDQTYNWKDEKALVVMSGNGRTNS